jgi:hypothetical protein
MDEILELQGGKARIVPLNYDALTMLRNPLYVKMGQTLSDKSTDLNNRILAEQERANATRVLAGETGVPLSHLEELLKRVQRISGQKIDTDDEEDNDDEEEEDDDDARKPSESTRAPETSWGSRDDETDDDYDGGNFGARSAGSSGGGNPDMGPPKPRRGHRKPTPSDQSQMSGDSRSNLELAAQIEEL